MARKITLRTTVLYHMSIFYSDHFVVEPAAIDILYCPLQAGTRLVEILLGGNGPFKKSMRKRIHCPLIETLQLNLCFLIFQQDHLF